MFFEQFYFSSIHDSFIYNKPSLLNQCSLLLEKNMTT